MRNQQKKLKVTALIQARMNSSRLPGKAMLPLAGKPLLYHIIQRIQCVHGVDTIVLATGTGVENKKIIQLAESMGIEIFIGSANNVLKRFYQASEKFRGDYIMRVTGDNPFTDPEYAEMAINIALESESDISSITNLPIGTAVGMIKKTALDEAYKQSTMPYQFEHVTPYIKEHPELFKTEYRQITLNNPFTNLRLTVDTPPDYELAAHIYSALYQGQPFTLRKLIDFLRLNPGLVKINQKIHQRAMTESSIQWQKK